MKRTFRASRHGLTRCAACGAHVHTAKNGPCEFCRRNPSEERRGLGGRASTIAGALLAFSASACGSAEPPPPEGPPVVESPPPEENIGVAIYGMPAEDGPPENVEEPEDDPEGENVVVPMYGVAPPE